MFAQRGDVGVVGGIIYRHDEKIEHAGFILERDGSITHRFRDQARGSVGYMGRLGYVQNLTAVSGSVMMFSKSAWKAIGGIDEHFRNKYWDIDFCLSLRDKGYLNVWTPYAEFYRERVNEPQKQTADIDKTYYLSKHENLLNKNDPYGNPNLRFIGQ